MPEYIIIDLQPSVQHLFYSSFEGIARVSARVFAMQA